MSHRLLLDTDGLRAAGHRIAPLAEALASVEEDARAAGDASVHSNLSNSLNSFASEWEYRRGRIVEALEALGLDLVAVAEVFDEADRAMDAALGGMDGGIGGGFGNPLMTGGMGGGLLSDEFSGGFGGGRWSGTVASFGLPEQAIGRSKPLMLSQHGKLRPCPIGFATRPRCLARGVSEFETHLKS